MCLCSFRNCPALRDILRVLRNDKMLQHLAWFRWEFIPSLKGRGRLSHTNGSIIQVEHCPHACKGFNYSEKLGISNPVTNVRRSHSLEIGASNPVMNVT
jgi:hypothetical protein